MKLDIYDFDKTVIPFDSGSRFWSYCIKKYPYIAVKIPLQVTGAIRFAFDKSSLTDMKKYFFSFIKMIPIEEAVKGFWDEYESEVFEWAKKENRERYSVLVSASPDFLINEIAGRLGFDYVICTKHDKNGKVIGMNCHDSEKVRRFKGAFPNAEVVCVYSDSIKHDRPIFSLGEYCFEAKNGKRIQFDFKQKYKV